jgi:hypothetical protein
VFSSTWRSGSAFGAWPKFLRQLLAAANAKWPGVRDLVSSRPGEAGSRLRSLFYQRLGLSEPDSHLAEPPLSTTGLNAGIGIQAFTVASNVAVDGTVRLHRRGADPRRCNTSLRTRRSQHRRPLHGMDR